MLSLSFFCLLVCTICDYFLVLLFSFWDSNRVREPNLKKLSEAFLFVWSRKAILDLTSQFGKLHLLLVTRTNTRKLDKMIYQDRVTVSFFLLLICFLPWAYFCIIFKDNGIDTFNSWKSWRFQKIHLIMPSLLVLTIQFKQSRR